MKQLLFFLFLVHITPTVFAQNDTIWFTKKWQKTTKDKAHFYRPQPIKKDSLYLLKDYYIDGQLQMEGLSKYKDKNYFQDVVIWYYKDGSIQSKAIYKNNMVKEESVMYYNNKKYIATYTNEGRIKNGSIVCSAYNDSQYIYTYKDEILNKTVYFFKNGNIKTESTYDIKGKIQKTKFYDLNGNLIGELNTSKDYKKEGVDIFYRAIEEKNKVVSRKDYYKNNRKICSDTYYKNGKPKSTCIQTPEEKTIYYNKQGGKIGEITYRLSNNYNSSFNGTQILFFSQFKHEELQDVIKQKNTYLNGEIVKKETFYTNGKPQTVINYNLEKKYPKNEIAYDEKGNTLGTLTYKNFKPFNGIKVGNESRKWYKEGKLIKAITYYNNTRIRFSSQEKNTITYYNKAQKPIETLEIDTTLNYEKPINGSKLSQNFNFDKLNVEIYTDGLLKKRIGWNKSYEDNRLYKKVIIYKDNYKKEKEINYYSNEKKQAEIIFRKDGYSKKQSIFYDIEGNKIAEYDYTTQNGTEYTFFNATDFPEKIITRNKGKIITKKEYHLPYSYENIYAKATKERPTILIVDVDVNSIGKYYDKQGNLIYQITFKNQKPYNGVFLDTKRNAFTYVNGIKEGIYKQHNYKLNDFIKIEGNYKNNKREGVFKHYNYNGKVTKTETFVNDILEGKTIFYEKGKKIAKIIYKNNKPYQGDVYTNKHITSYKNGKKISELNRNKKGNTFIEFLEDQKKTTIYHPNSKLKKYSFYEKLNNSYLNGKITSYNKKGKPKHSAIVKNGALVSGEIWVSSNSYRFPESSHIVLKKDATHYYLFIKNKTDEILFEAKEKITKSRLILDSKLYINSYSLKASDLY